MAKILIVQFFINVFADKDDEFETIQKDIAICKNEFLDHYSNPDLTVITISYETMKGQVGKAKVDIMEMKKGVAQFIPITQHFDQIRLQDFGDSGNLVYIFDQLYNNYPHDIKILSTFDHGYGFIMSREPTDQDFKLILSSKVLLALLKEMHEKGIILDTELKSIKRLHSYLKKEEERNVYIQLGFNKNSTPQQKVILPANVQIEKKDNENPDEPPVIISIDKITSFTINELKQSIEKSKFKKFDAIIMLNCFMQTVDTVYALQGQCNYLVAAQTGHWFAGYDYAALMSITQPDEAFFQHFLNATVQKLQGLKDDLAISCLNIDSVKPLFDGLKKIIQRLSELPLGKSLVEARAITKDLTESSFAGAKSGINLVDVLYFFRNVASIVKDTTLDSFIQETASALKTARVAIHTGINYKDQPFDKATGISIFFPGRKTENVDVLDDLFTYYFMSFQQTGAQIVSAFAKELGWGLFLEKYYEKLIQGTS